MIEKVERVVLNALPEQTRLRRLIIAPSANVVIVFGAVRDAKQRRGFHPIHHAQIG